MEKTARISMQNRIPEGMIPIAKNVTVLDGSGKMLEPTYEKRAKGLVKHGRARWENEDTIRLTCPPGDCQEDTTMNDNIYRETIEQNRPEAHTPDTAYIMSKIDEIAADTGHIHEAMGLLRDFTVNDSAAGGYGDKARAEAIWQIVQAREETNRELIGVLNRMLDALIPQPSLSREEVELEKERLDRYSKMLENLMEYVDFDIPQNMTSYMDKMAKLFERSTDAKH